MSQPDRRAALLIGGTSSEREISLISGAACLSALRALGCEVESFDPKEKGWISALETFAPDVVFNALHGTPGEDGTVQGVLELLRVPYTHSGVLASAVAMDKELSKALFREVGIPTPKGQVLSWQELLSKDPLPRPFILKPIREGSSVGVSIVDQATDLRSLQTHWTFGSRLLIEEYIPGRELTVCVLEDRSLGVTELVSRRAFYDYEAKYTEGVTEHCIDPPLPDGVRQQAMHYALQAHQSLKCRGATRVDMRYDPSAPTPKGLYVLEVNTQPGMTPTSLLPEQARHAGLSFQELVLWMLERAQRDCDG
ncbi:MAG: D-alanine--D-alanine ligase [Holosporales bacterium]|jgi:D-alanine-D-alanine ligase|nr:D-alanine--D-alanine ligase [Holosporales bacterium]